MTATPSFFRRAIVHAALSVLCFALVAAAALLSRHHAGAGGVALHTQLAAAIDDSTDAEGPVADDPRPSQSFGDTVTSDTPTDSADGSSWSRPSFDSAGSWLSYARGFAPSPGSRSLSPSPGSPVTPAALDDPPFSAHAQSGPASWYDTTPATCAHRVVPKGSVIRVTNPANGKSATCTVEGWGPSDTTRVIDLSQDTFDAIADPDQGVVPVNLTW
jgi:hypothetical protein